ncbi:anti-virulence regulator CigR family protein [Pseudomonas oryzae]
MFKSRSAVVLLTGLVLAAGSPALLAEPRGKDEHPQQMHSPQQGKGNQGQKGAAPQGHQPQNGKPASGGPSRHDGHGDFRVDSERIRVTIGDNRAYWNPGKPLPPGIRNNLQRGKPLPPGIARQQLDRRLVSRLPYHEGHEWVRVGTDLVQVSISTGLINAVLNDMFN